MIKFKVPQTGGIEYIAMKIRHPRGRYSDTGCYDCTIDPRYEDPKFPSEKHLLVQAKKIERKASRILSGISCPNHAMKKLKDRLKAIDVRVT